MLHAAKVVALLLLTLLVMRAASWVPGWLLRRFANWQRPRVALASNATGLGVFVVFLVTERIPGQWIDPIELGFGVLVFAVYTGIDLRWTRWGRPPGPGAAPR